MQHSDFITGLGNLNTNMQNSYARLNDSYKRNLLIRLSSPPYKLHAAHIVLNCPTKFCSNFITVCVYSIFSFDYSKFNEIPSFLLDYIELQDKKKTFLQLYNQLGTSLQLFLALHDITSKYPKLRLQYCFVSSTDLKMVKLHTFTSLKIYIIKPQT